MSSAGPLEVCGDRPALLMRGEGRAGQRSAERACDELQEQPGSNKGEGPREGLPDKPPTREEPRKEVGECREQEGERHLRALPFVVWVYLVRDADSAL